MNQFMPRHKKFVMGLGSVVCMLLLMAYQQQFRSKGPLSGVDQRLVLAYGLLIALFAYASGLPDRPFTKWETAWRSMLAPVIAACLLSLALTVFDRLMISRFLVTASPLLTGPWLFLCSTWSQRDNRSAGLDLAVAVGTREELGILSAMDYCEHERHVKLVDTADTADIHRAPNQLVVMARAAQASIIILGRSAQALPDVLDAAAQLHSQGVRVRSITQFYDEWLGKLPVSDIATLRLMFDVRQIHDASYARLKRIIDLTFGFPLLAVCAVLVPPIALANFFERILRGRNPDSGSDGASLFYSQERIGFDSKPFRIWKFRSMRPGSTTAWTEAGDTRITSVGRVLRRTHLDELPQAWNLVRGELSLVGPRPEQSTFVDELKSKIPHYDFRHLVRPGLTGWAQVKYHYGASEGDAVEKLEYDLYYVRHQTLRLDASIMLRTIRHLVLDGGR
jgi:lipopolysaccharide/colanic/teichoic acid biosynthesis glycosyltransferase